MAQRPYFFWFNNADRYDDGSLWLLDQSHGGGGRFELHST